MKGEGNPSQTWLRLRARIRVVIDDLKLLAQKLPDDKQEQVFSYEMFYDLISCLLGNEHVTRSFPKSQLLTKTPLNSLTRDENLDPRRTKLALAFVTHSLWKFKKQCGLMETNRIFLEQLIEPLEQADSICDAIYDKVRSESATNKHKKTKKTKKTKKPR